MKKIPYDEKLNFPYARDEADPLRLPQRELEDFQRGESCCLQCKQGDPKRIDSEVEIPEKGKLFCHYSVIKEGEKSKNARSRSNGKRNKCPEDEYTDCTEFQTPAMNAALQNCESFVAPDENDLDNGHNAFGNMLFGDCMSKGVLSKCVQKGDCMNRGMIVVEQSAARARLGY